MAVVGQVTREASIYLAGFLGAAFLQFLAVPIYTRILGPDEYAQFALTQAVTASLAGVLVLGGDVALARFWFDANTNRERHDLAVSWIGFLTLWSIVVVALSAAFSSALATWLSPSVDLRPLLLVGLVTLVPAQLSRMLAQILRNEFRPIPFAITTVLVGGLSMAFGLLFAVTWGMGPLGILGGALLAEAVVCLVRLPLVRRQLRGRPSWVALKSPLLFGVPLVPASVAMWVFTGADRIAVGRYLSPTDLGAYSVAAVLVAPFSVLLLALAQAWIPRVSQRYETSPAEASASTGLAIELALLGFGLGAVALGAIAAPAMRVFAGPEYAAGAQAIPILALGSVFLGTSLFTQTGSTLAKRTGFLPVITVVAAIANVTLLVLLVPRLGLAGASVAVCVGYLLLATGTFTYSQHCFPVPIHWRTVTAVCLTLASAALVNTMRPSTTLSWLWSTAAIIGLLTVGWLKHVRRA